MTEWLMIALILVTLVGTVTVGICIKLIKQYRLQVSTMQSHMIGLREQNDELKLRIQMMEEANAKANAITDGDAAVAELSKPRQKRSRKTT